MSFQQVSDDLGGFIPKAVHLNEDLAFFEPVNKCLSVTFCKIDVFDILVLCTIQSTVN